MTPPQPARTCQFEDENGTRCTWELNAHQHRWCTEHARTIYQEQNRNRKAAQKGHEISQVGKPMRCEHCGEWLIRTSPTLRYHSTCAEIKEREHNQKRAAQRAPRQNISAERLQENIDRIVAEAQAQEGHGWGKVEENSYGRLRGIRL